MNSAISLGTVHHLRIRPVRHDFTFRYICYRFDLDELDELDQAIPGFGHNRIRRSSVHDTRHLDYRPGTIREKLVRLLDENGVSEEPARIHMVTAASYLNRVFNPVSFYYCYRADGELLCLAAEVNNTFGDRHIYVLREPCDPDGIWYKRYEGPKEFHVSPFNDMKGKYEFLVADVREKLDISVNILKPEGKHFAARLQGSWEPLTAESYSRIHRRHPLLPLMTIPRIVWHGLQLRFRRKLPVFHRPQPHSPRTIRQRKPGRLTRFLASSVFRLLARTRVGGFRVELPDRKIECFGPDGNNPSAAVINIADWNFFRRCSLNGGIGFGEAYMYGEWDSPDLTRVVATFVDNWHLYTDRNMRSSIAGRTANFVRHLLRANTRRGSKRNITEHYDLSPSFFSLFLDESLMYSCGIYAHPGDTLAEAQRNKLDTVIRKARIESHHHVLEIGCGWGSFAIHAAKTTGCRVTGITISEAQYEFARKRVAEAGLQDRIAILLKDYRDVEGTFDRIVSIEMLEAVGHRFYGDFFRACADHLGTDGLVVLQVITMPDHRYDSYRRSSDWIRKYIFPGGLLPSLTSLSSSITKNTDLFVEDLENIGINYAATLADWRERFEENIEKVRALGFDDVFVRKWRFYFCFCEAGFMRRSLNDLQIVLTRQGNRSLPAARDIN